MPGTCVVFPEKIQRCMRALGVSFCSHLGKQVYLVDSRSYGKVAIKLAHSTLAKSQLQTEAQFLARHPSPFWPQFIDTNSEQQIDWLMYSYIDARPLTDCPSGITRPLIQQLEIALQRLHQQGFIHGDIKPSNLLINQQNQPILIDFGAISPIGCAYSQLATSSITPSFSALNPLLRQGLVAPCHDYYSLAITIESVNQAHPLQGLNLIEWAEQKKPLKFSNLNSKYQVIIAEQIRQTKQYLRHGAHKPKC